MTALVIGLFALLFLAALALPFLDTSLAEPLPDTYDPVRRDLEEERDALLRATRELNERTDLGEEKRRELQARYEAKTARVLKRLDEYERPAPRPRRIRRIPASLALLGILSVPSVALLGSFVLPRVSQGGTVTTNREGEIARGRDLQRQQRAARRDPSAENLLALGDTYWELANQSLAEISQNQGGTVMDMSPRYLDETRETYQRVVAEVSPVPSVAYRRLGFLKLMENDPEAALPYLEQAVAADPDDAEAQYTLGEVQYYFGNMGAAAQAFEAFLTQADEADTEVAQQLLANARTLEPLVRAVDEDRSAATLLALANAYWGLDERNRAANLYAEVVQLGVEDAQATSRIGQAIFFNGDAEQAVLALERAKELNPENLDTLLFLGNAYFSLGEDERAIDVWQAYVEVAGGPETAGRVPQLIEQAEARLRGEATEPLAQTPLPGAATPSPATEQVIAAGEALYAANCATCHGVNAGGGAGPRLAGNARLRDEAMVRNTVQYGRGMMPGFGSLLSDDELERLVSYVMGLAEGE